jgi:hypothetical protein
VTARDLEHGWQLTGSSADAYEQLLVPAIFEPWAHLGDVLDTYVDDDGLALPIESHVALATAGSGR